MAWRRLRRLGCWGLAGWALAAAGCERRPPAPSSAAIALPEAAGEWRAEARTASYDPRSIFDYIDGHAEVYLAYGLRSAWARRYVGPPGEAAITVDLFELASAEDAFGVFTHDQDGDAVELGGGGLYRWGWLSFWQGPFFVSITAESESAAAKAASLELGRALAARLPRQGEPHPLVAALPRDGLLPRSVRFLRSPQILAASRPFGEENPLALGPEVAAALGRYERGGERALLLLVDYREPANAQRALAALAERFPGGADGGGAAHFRLEGARLALAVDAASPEIAAALVDEVLGSTGGGRG